MGGLVAKAYPTAVLANRADHTYVECANGGKAWGCWGGKTGGHVLGQGTGSTKRADAIAEPNERAGLTCYLVNGVCHQAANRILVAAGMTVWNARGYGISSAMFGTYGRVGFWPCKAPFNKHVGVTGDLPECLAAHALAGADAQDGRQDHDRDAEYIRSVLELYSQAKPLMSDPDTRTQDAEDFHVRLFMHMAEFVLQSEMTPAIASRLQRVRRNAEQQIMKLQGAFSEKGVGAREYVESFDELTLGFQDAMAECLDSKQYEQLLGVPADERIKLSDPTIVKATYGFSMDR